ncbi:MAG: adenine phosphoribosyltransferase [Kosmotoga sp.]|uniref:adenine phosphoribosyltransferase n=1 Tax=Kosmotoga sp. TaxID=1955248 RepID=UPI001DD648BF|nr:adenine phosphoribosyltransferase [Kosmotoga sp.]MBO8165598.1 adenine phosphoribosyltransferase [Kosmotoga sp.]MCD6160430.1 adenine phosphoribosyltransferase [Kosmotoga sp.]
MDLKHFIRDIPDFPKPGIIFKDVTPLLKNSEAFKESIGLLKRAASSWDFDLIVAPEARGFIFAAPLALEMDKGFVPIRKPGKLPYEVISKSYSLEYGEATLEMHTDAIAKGNRVLILDDVLATGGTIKAIAEMIKEAGGEVAGILTIIELSFLEPRKKLKDYQVKALITY